MESSPEKKLLIKPKSIPLKIEKAYLIRVVVQYYILPIYV
jgi:hypothetical protein